ncbi:MAG: SAP domain-containing protein [Candidatus Poseidoniaceae archaeon]
MAGKSIDEEISDLLISAKAYQSSEPVYSLLLCRKAAEAFLMKKHLQMVTDGEAKEVLTLGDAYNNRLGLKEILSPLEIMSIQFIQNATNPFLHFRVNKLELREDLIPRVLQELLSLTGTKTPNYNIDDNDSKTLDKKDWRVVLRREIKQYNWPDDLQGTIFCNSWLKKNINSIKSQINVLKGKEITLPSEGFTSKSPRKMTIVELKKELIMLELKVSGNKSELTNRLIEEHKVKRKNLLNSNKGQLKHLNKRIQIFQEILRLNSDERLEILSESTEAGLILLYNAWGDRKWKHNQMLGKRRLKPFYDAIKEMMPYDLPLSTIKSRWKFLFDKGKLKQKWEFFDIR